jgi:hypothetical protein
MRVIIEILFSLPTGVFTVALAFCLSWWISSFLIGGLDHGSTHSGHSGSGQASHGASDHSHIGGAGRAGRSGRMGRSGRSLGRSSRRTLANTAVPASLRWTVASAVAWSVSLLGSSVIRAVSLTGASLIAALAVLAVGAALVGRSASRSFARLVVPIFAAPDAPGRKALVGSHARVRSLEVTDMHGEAKVVDGRSSGAIVRVRTTGLQKPIETGAIVQLVSFDPDAEVYLIDLADPDVVGW